MVNKALTIESRSEPYARHSDVRRDLGLWKRLRVLFAHVVEIGLDRAAVHHISITPTDIPQVVIVRPFVGITDTAFGNDRAKAMRETIDSAGPHAAAGGAARNDHRIDVVFGEEGCERRVEEDRRCRFGENVIILFVPNFLVHRHTVVIEKELFANRADLPVRHILIGPVPGEAACDRDAAAPGHIEQLGRLVAGIVNVLETADRIFRVGEGCLKIHHNDSGPFAEADGVFAVAGPLIGV